MRLLRVVIDEFRSIENQCVPMEGLVVLFGPNSAGKTSVLEAVEQLFTQAAALRADPADFSDVDVTGSVWFDLPGAGLPGSEDARLYRSLLCGEYGRAGGSGSSEDRWGWLRDGLTAQLKDADLGEARLLLASALASAGSAGSMEDRELLARFVFDPSAVLFTASDLGVDLVAFGPSMPAVAMDAARRIAPILDGHDQLLKVAADLVSSGIAHICHVADGSGSSAEALPPVIVLDGDTESLSAELQRAVPAIHDRLWHVEPEVLPSTFAGATTLSAEDFNFVSLMHAATRTVEDFEISEYGRANRYSPDGWLEGRSEEGEPDLPPNWGPYDEGEWYRVRHTLRAAAKAIEAEANQVAPEFVTRQGTIGVEILPVSVWGGGLPRVRVTFTEPGQETRDLKVVGAGTARWAAAAARLACRRLQAGSQVATDDAGALVEDEAEKHRIVSLARSAPLTQQAVHLEPSDAPAVYIADEPEAHLHPAALHSVRQWLTELAEKATTVLVATHSHALLDSTSELVNRVRVHRDEEGTRLRLMPGSLDEELGRFSEELGISRGELLLMTQLALFVEGPHDQIILDEWFGDVLRGAGIRVFPVHGVDNLPGLAESEVTAALGIRIATLSDDTCPSRASSGSPRTRGEHAVGRLLDEAARAGIEVHPVGLDQPDILYYLDETICRHVAPAFPGWDAAEAERRNARSRMRWKRWVEDRYGLSLTREAVRRLAQMCRQEHKIPAELTRKVYGLTAYATASSPET